jgi:hypothetical protein
MWEVHTSVALYFDVIIILCGQEIVRVKCLLRRYGLY